MAEAPVLPRGPVTEQQAVEDPRLHLAGLLRLQLRRIARERCRTPDTRPTRTRATCRRATRSTPLASVAMLVTFRATGFGPIGATPEAMPTSRGACVWTGRRHETASPRFASSRRAWTRTRSACRRATSAAARRRPFRAVSWTGVPPSAATTQMSAVARVRFLIDVGDDIGDPCAIRRQLRIADALEAQHVVDGEACSAGAGARSIAGRLRVQQRRRRPPTEPRRW